MPHEQIGSCSAAKNSIYSKEAYFFGNLLNFVANHAIFLE